MTLAAATRPRAFESERLLVVAAHERAVFEQKVTDLPEFVSPGDIVVVNDAATLPASLRLTNYDAELRLLGRRAASSFVAVLFGAGDHRTPTELRPEPPRFARDTALDFGGLRAHVVAELGPRLYVVEFDRDGAELIRAIHRVGRPVQYAYAEGELELWDVQNRFAARPWASELPSAGRPLTWNLIGRLRRKGVEVAGLTHAAGLSSTGLGELDRRLPFAEHSEIPVSTIEAISRTKRAGGRVIAVGTTVVRALEDAAGKDGAIEAGPREARLVIGPGFRPRVVDALLTGLHETNTSHFCLMQAFAPGDLLEAAIERAARAGFLQHEFGDSCLILPSLTELTPEPRARGGPLRAIAEASTRAPGTRSGS
jgi:S-adenosylmethionine:tRNA ribosyltransferase-isomerase